MVVPAVRDYVLPRMVIMNRSVCHVCRLTPAVADAEVVVVAHRSNHLAVAVAAHRRIGKWVEAGTERRHSVVRLAAH